MKKYYGTIGKLAVFVLLCLGFLLFFKFHVNIPKEVHYIDINKDSNLYYNEQLVCVGDIKQYNIKDTQYGDEIRIEKRIAGKKIVNPVLAFNNSMNLAYEIRIDGKKIKGLAMKAKKDSVVCDDFVILPIKDVHNKNIEIIFKVINEKAVKYVPKIICINGLEMEHIYFVSIMDYLFLGMVMVEVGILMLVFMLLNVILKVFNMKNVYISLISIFAGIWILCCFQASSYVLSSKVVDIYMEHISFALTLIFANLYVQEVYKEEKIKDVLKILNIVLIITTVGVILLQVYNKVFIEYSITAVYIHAIPLVVLLIKKFLGNKNGKERTLGTKIVRISIVVILAIVFVVMRFLSDRNSVDVLNGVILVYIIIIYQAIYAVIVEVNDEYVMHAAKKGLQKLAYLDTLTGISNRHGMDKYVNGIEKEQVHRFYKVFSFDLNRLKYINDNYGHAAGDILLKDFANSLKHCVDGKHEYCGRIGGDEFIVIVLENRANEFIKKLRKYVKTKNKNGEFKYEVSYSFGGADYESFAGKDINDSIRMADYYMYEMKSAYRLRHKLEYEKDNRLS